ncbi:hypothetical protein HMPREF9238_01163 [Gleimia europaea ACS-120-V-Col10b]|uniref:SpaA-like prealbumin fold domain-containing protein n=1 Tax=Gleimia europaea ACS-120-V-Col10b TaxID=883069 RepID=A0A9W5RFD1_9ACTO|nr:hypothetical protein HMPREF9238_01163 [Gleimia europaea ACS-120-V-Col10b]
MQTHTRKIKVLTHVLAACAAATALTIGGLPVTSAHAERGADTPPATETGVSETVSNTEAANGTVASTPESEESSATANNEAATGTDITQERAGAKQDSPEAAPEEDVPFAGGNDGDSDGDEPYVPDEPSGGDGEHTGDGDDSHYYWVNVGTDLKYPDRNKLVQFKVSDDLNKIERVRDFSAAFKSGYGDIAVSQDGKTMWGLQYIGIWSNNFPSLSKHDAITGEQEWWKPLRIDDGSKKGKQLPRSAFDIFDIARPQANALSYDNQGRLLFSSAKAKHGQIFAAYPDLAEGKDFVPVKEIAAKWPVQGGRQLSSAGDFVIGPDGALYGLATNDEFDANGPSYLVRWEFDKETNDFAEKGVVVGKTEKPGFGLARIDNKLFMALTSATHGSAKGNATLQFDLTNAKPQDPSVKLKDIPFLNSTIVEMAPLGGVTWGATSQAEGGPAPNEGYLIVRKNFVESKDRPTGRARETDQVQLWSTRTDGSRLTAAVETTGNKPGVQKEEHIEYVKAGSKHLVYEKLVGSDKATFDDYTVSVSCTAVDAQGNPTGENLSVTAPKKAENTQTSELNVSKVPGATTICTFSNDGDLGPLEGELPFTGVEQDIWATLGTLLFAFLLGAPVLRGSNKTRRDA